MVDFFRAVLKFPSWDMALRCEAGKGLKGTGLDSEAQNHARCIILRSKGFFQSLDFQMSYFQ